MAMRFPTIAKRIRPRRRCRRRPEPMFGGRATFAEQKKTYEAQLRELKEFFEEARRYQKAKAAHAPGFKPDLKFEAMLPVLEGKVPLVAMTPRERAIRDAVQFADEQKVKLVIADPHELGKMGPELKAKNIPAILGPTLALAAARRRSLRCGLCTARRVLQSRREVRVRHFQQPVRAQSAVSGRHRRGLRAAVR